MTTNRVWRYLEELRRSGVTNMYGAAPYLEAEFGFSHKQAVAELSDWMQHYNPDDYEENENGES